MTAVFRAYLERWRLAPDGAAIKTHSSDLLPVRLPDGVAAMLKIANAAEEKRAAKLMLWWQGQGAARVLAYDDGALLLERAEGARSLAAMARGHEDEAACQILCRAVAALHEKRPGPLPPLAPLDRWFAPLEAAAARDGGVLVQSLHAAHALLASPQDVVVLHGDIHHDNVLDFGARGWLAIDPHALIGERGFDYANIFENPDHRTAADPARFARRLAVMAESAALDRRRLLQWVLAWSGLSAAWFLDDGLPADTPRAVAALAAAELAR